MEYSNPFLTRVASPWGNHASPSSLRKRSQANGPSLPAGYVVPQIISTMAISDSLHGIGLAFSLTPYTSPYPPVGARHWGGFQPCGLYLPVPAGGQDPAGPPQSSLSGSFHACHRLLHRRALRVPKPIYFPASYRLRPSNESSPPECPTLPVIRVGLPLRCLRSFVFLRPARLPCRSDWLRVARFPRFRCPAICFSPFPESALGTGHHPPSQGGFPARDFVTPQHTGRPACCKGQAIGPKWEIGRVRTYI